MLVAVFDSRPLPSCIYGTDSSGNTAYHFLSPHWMDCYPDSFQVIYVGY